MQGRKTLLRADDIPGGTNEQSDEENLFRYCKTLKTSLEGSQQLFFLPKDYFDLRLIFTGTCLTFFKLKFLIFRSISLLIFEVVDIWNLLTMALTLRIQISIF